MSMYLISQESFSARRTWVSAHLRGTDMASPGHPLVLAVMVLERFGSMSEATHRRFVEDTRTDAELDPFIPATPEAVRTALEVLEIGLQLGPETAIATARERWASLYQSGIIAEGHVYSTGKFQADWVEEEFRAKLRAWQSLREYRAT